MPSRFPGMDPYLEDPAFWPDFHDSFIVYWRDALNDRLPDSYEARVNERTRVIDLETGGQALPKPDIAIHRADASDRHAPDHGGVATLQPVTLPFRLLDEVRETYIEIRRRPDRTVIAVLELLSPSNKHASDRHLYLDTRNPLWHQDVHIIELDLLIGGDRIPLGSPLPQGDYFLFVTHMERRTECGVYHWTVRGPLPTLPIPLQSPDGPVYCDFGAVFTTAYDRGRYARALAYEQPPLAALSEADRRWAMEVARTARAGR